MKKKYNMKRFDLVGICGHNLWCEMEIHEDGDWVSYEEAISIIEALQRELLLLKKDLADRK